MTNFFKIATLLLLTSNMYWVNANAQVCSNPTQLPYFESFNAPLNIDSIPQCSSLETAPNGGWRATTGGLGGTQCFGAITAEIGSFRLYSWWFTPKFELISGHNYKLSYYLKSAQSSFDYASSLTIKYGDCPSSVCTTTHLGGVKRTCY